MAIESSANLGKLYPAILCSKQTTTSTELLYPKCSPLAMQRFSELDLDCTSELCTLLHSCLKFVLNETVVLGQIKVQQDGRGL